MIIVTFEIVINDGCMKDYLQQAGKLLPLVKEIDGFISVERYQSIIDTNKMISVSKWENMEAVSLWKKNILHHQAQEYGKKYIFKNYTICVSKVDYSYEMQS